ncbi:MAG: hypothetical protein AAF318_18020 [Pseudomonadota bacterium]
MLSFQSLMAHSQQLSNVRKDALATGTALQTGSLARLSESRQSATVAALERSDAAAFRTTDTLVGHGTRGMTSAVSALRANAAALTDLRDSLDAIRTGGNDVARVNTALNAFQTAAFSASAEALSASPQNLPLRPDGQSAQNANFLASGGSNDRTFVSAYAKKADGSIGLSTITLSTPDMALYGDAGILSRAVATGAALTEVSAHDLVGTDGTNGWVDLNAAIAQIDNAVGELEAAAQKGVRLEQRLSNQEQYLLDVAEIKDGLEATFQSRAAEAAEKKLASLEERYDFMADAIDIGLTIQRNVLHLFGHSFTPVSIERSPVEAEAPADDTARPPEPAPVRGTSDIYDPITPATVPAGADTFTFGVDNPAGDNVLSGVNTGGTVSIDASTLNLRQNALTLWLVDADTDERVQRLSVGGDLDPAGLSGGNYAIEAEIADPALGAQSVRFTINGATTVDNSPAAFSFGAAGTDIAGAALPGGPLTIRAEAFTEDGAAGDKVIDASFTFNQGAASAPDAVSADQVAFDALIAELDAAERAMRAPLGLSAISANMDRTDTIEVTVAGQTLTYDFGNAVRAAPTQTVTANASTVNGTAGNDGVLVTNGAEITTLSTGAGNDTVNAAAGGDTAAYIDGANASDAAFGGHLGTATLGDGTNTLSVNGRVDAVTGGAGEDAVFAREAGTMSLGDGGDVVVLSGAVGTITTGAGDDGVIVGSSTGTVDLGADDDTFRATAGAANVIGGLGADTLQLDAGGTAEGGAGRDTFIYDFATATGAATTVDGGADQDRLVVRADNGGITQPQLDALIAELDALDYRGDLPTRLNGLNMDLSSIERVEVVNLEGVVTNYRFDGSQTGRTIFKEDGPGRALNAGENDVLVTNGANVTQIDLADENTAVEIDEGANLGTLNALDGDDDIVVRDGATVGTMNLGGRHDDVTVQGGAAVDSLDAGWGNDEILVEDTASVRIIDAGVNNDAVTLTTTQAVERVNLGEGDDTLIATTFIDTLHGGYNGADDITIVSANAVNLGRGDDTLVATGTVGTFNDDGGSNTLSFNNVGTITMDTDPDGGGDAITVSGTLGSASLGEGNDQITLATTGTVDGGAGNDTINGGTGANTLTGGAGADLVNAGDGDDNITVAVGDTANGGAGDDAFILDPSQTEGAGTITINGGSDATEGAAAGLENGNAGDILDVTGLTNVTWAAAPVDDGTGSFSGTFTYEDDNGDTVTVNFTGIEQLIGGPDGVVDGAATGEAMGVGYLDGNGDGITNGADFIDAGAGEDTIAAGSGNDTISGGTGRDTIVLANGAGNDVVTDFDMTDSGDGTTVDQLDVSALTNAGVPVTTADVTVTDTNGDGTGDAILTFAGGESVTLQGVLASEVDEAAELQSIGIASAGNGVVQGAGSAQNMTVGYTDADGDQITNGSDSIHGSGFADTIEGGAGDDTIDGNFGSDSIDGGTGDDVFVASGGDNTLRGGDGSDTFGIGAGNDTIIGGEGGTDRDVIDARAINDATNFTFTGNGAGTYSDSDGDTGAFSEIEALVLSDNNDTLDGTADAAGLDVDAGAGNDSIVGGAANDTLDGDAGNDTLSGGALNDVISGGDGNDELRGDGGDDTIDGNSGDDRVVMENAFGNDELRGGETVETTGDTLDGSAVTQDLTVNYASDEAGSFSNGSASANFAEFERVLLGSGNDVVNAAASTGGIDIDLGAGNDTVTGGSGNDRITGGSGRDTFVIADGAGSDTITDFDMSDVGGVTADQLDVSGLTHGGAPVTTADVTVTDTNGDGTGDAILTFAGGESVTLQGVLASEVDEAAELESLGIAAAGDGFVVGTSASENMTTGYTDADGDQITNGDDIILGGGGTDTIDGGLGNDMIVGGNDDDVMSDSGGNDTLDGGAGNDTLNGGAGDDVVGGSLGSDSIDGGSGNDTVGGGTGNDTVTGGAGNDTFVIRNGSDQETITDFEMGTDQLDVTGLTFGGNQVTTDDVTVTDTNGDGSGDAVLTFAGGQVVTLQGISSTQVDEASELQAIGIPGPATTPGVVDGTAAGETMSNGYTDADGDSIGSGNDSIRGGDGNDTLFDFAGNDTMDGGNGNDVIGGGAGNDVLTGGAGNDSVNGGSGNDTITAGDGADTLTGGSGNDVFIYNVNGTLGDGSQIDGGAHGTGDTVELNFSNLSEVGDEAAVEAQLANWVATSTSSGTLTAINLYMENIESVILTREDGSTRTFSL